MHRSDILYLGAEDVAQIVGRQGLGECLKALTHYLREDFSRWADFSKAARSATYSSQGVIELMPIADHQHYAFKYVNGHPGNPQLGWPTVMAFGVLAEVATGAPLLLCDMSLCTALRTAATSALAASEMARPDAKCMALIGCGAQSEFQAQAFADLLGVERVRCFDPDARAMHKLRYNLADHALSIEMCDSAADAVREADIVTTLTAASAHAHVITTEMLRPGVHLNALGGDSPGKTEIHPDVLAAARVVVEYAPQSRVEGEIQQMPADFPVLELWQVLAGLAAGRSNDEEITLFDSVGFALEDFSALRFLLDSAHELGVGHTLPLLPAQGDPKNLYSTLHLPRNPRAPRFPAGRSFSLY